MKSILELGVVIFLRVVAQSSRRSVMYGTVDLALDELRILVRLASRSSSLKNIVMLGPGQTARFASGLRNLEPEQVNELRSG